MTTGSPTIPTYMFSFSVFVFIAHDDNFRCHKINNSGTTIAINSVQFLSFVGTHLQRVKIIMTLVITVFAKMLNASGVQRCKTMDKCALVEENCKKNLWLKVYWRGAAKPVWFRQRTNLAGRSRVRWLRGFHRRVSSQFVGRTQLRTRGRRLHLMRFTRLQLSPAFLFFGLCE